MEKRAKKRIALLTGLGALALLACVALPKLSEEGPLGSGPETPIQIQEQEPGIQDDQLRVTRLGSYSGIYMEDGTDEILSGVMMILLENTSDRDLQLARVEIEYPDFTAEFEVTTVPAGERVVALERSRREAVDEDYLQIRTRNVVFFEEPMELYGDRIGISGLESHLDVTNLSPEDIDGDFYIYYKNSAEDLLYGGITYRVRVEGGLASGETVRVIAGHYSPENSRIMMITGLE